MSLVPPGRWLVDVARNPDRVAVAPAAPLFGHRFPEHAPGVQPSVLVAGLALLDSAHPHISRLRWVEPWYSAHGLTGTMMLGALELRTSFETLKTRLALNRSVHRLDQVSWSLAPEDGVGSVVEVIEQVLDLWAGVEWVVAVVFLVSVAPVQRP